MSGAGDDVIAPLRWRLADKADAAHVLDAMRLFHDEDQIAFDPALLGPALDVLLTTPAHGEVLLWLDHDDAPCGYAVLAMGFSLEQGGAFVLLDELYLDPRVRGRGLGRRALDVVRARAHARGVTRVRMEVNHHNAAARRLYLRDGFVDERRDLLTLTLDGAAH